MNTDDLGMLTGHCDSCNKPCDYCTCTEGACPGCTHCENDDE